MKHEIDTGEVIQQVRVPIADTDNVGIVHDKLMMLGGRLVVETVDAIIAGKVKPVPQEEMAVVGELRPAPKIFKDTCRIDWNMPVKRIYDLSAVCLLTRLHGRNWCNRTERWWY